MKGRSRSLVLAAAVLALVVATTGCGSKKKSSTPPAADDHGRCGHDHDGASSQTPSVPRRRLDAPVRAPASRRSRPPATASSCPISRPASARRSPASEQRLRGAREAAEGFRRQDAVRHPARLRGAGLTRSASTRRRSRTSTSQPGQVPDAATLAKLQKLASSINQAKVTQASTHITAWAQKNCSHS